MSALRRVSLFLTLDNEKSVDLSNLAGIGPQANGKGLNGGKDYWAWKSPDQMGLKRE